VLAGGANGSVFVWDMDRMEIEDILDGVHSAPITSVAWKSHDTEFVSADNVGGLVVWG
jgi:WD40 repeat protein